MIILRLALRRAAARPLTIILFLVVPVGALILSLHGTVATVDGQAGLPRGAVVDHDGTDASRELRDVLSRDLGPVVPAELRDVMNLLVEEEIHYAVIVPAGYEEALLNIGERTLPPLEVVSLRGRGLFLAVETVLQRSTGHMPATAPAITPGPTPSPTPMPERTSESGPTPASAGEGALAATTVQPVRTLVGVLMLTLLLGTVFNTFEMVRDREQRILHRLLVAPGGTVVYVAQHGLALALIALVQAMTGVAAIATAFGIDPAGALRLAVVILLFALTATALALAIAGRVNSLSEAALAAGFLILPLVMAGGGFWSSANMSRAAARLAYLLPTTWAMAAAEGVLDGAPLVSYSVHLLALGLFTAFLALLGPWKREDLGIR